MSAGTTERPDDATVRRLDDLAEMLAEGLVDDANLWFSHWPEGLDSNWQGQVLIQASFCLLGSFINLWVSHAPGYERDDLERTIRGQFNAFMNHLFRGACQAPPGGEKVN